MPRPRRPARSLSLITRRPDDEPDSGATAAHAGAGHNRVTPLSKAAGFSAEFSRDRA